jgi:hypothetical protein
VDYVPWPENGCSLAEARRRAVGRGHFAQSIPLAKECTEPNQSESRDFLDHLRNGRLIASACPSESSTGRQLITAAQWQSVERVDWQSSSAVDGRPAGHAFFDIRVYPCLLAPCRIDLLAGWTLAEAFSRTVLGDPEVGALGREAVRASPPFEAVFVKGHCQTRTHCKEWPLAFERWPMASTVHPDPAKRSKFDCASQPDALEAVIATEAMKHRYCALISVLRRGELECRGLAAEPGDPDIVPRSIWSHRNFYLDAGSGDVLQDHRESVARYHILTRRWFGVVLHKPDSNAQAFAAMFHGKPSLHDGLLSATPTPQEAAIKQSRAVGRVETKLGARKACESWLIKMMEGSKDKRLYSIEELWLEAQSKWPGILSERQFLAARSDAIRVTNAFAWGAAGAPRKSPHSNRRTD